jgi:hypothetical protein
MGLLFYVLMTTMRKSFHPGKRIRKTSGWSEYRNWWDPSTSDVFVKSHRAFYGEGGYGWRAFDRAWRGKCSVAIVNFPIGFELATLSLLVLTVYTN